MTKTARRSWFFIENYQKQHFACERRAKNAKNSPSLVFFHRKLPKTAFRLQAMGEKRGKQPVACVFSSKIAKNSVSLASDEQKTTKTARRSWFFIENYQKQHFACERRAKKREKLCFGASRKVEIQKNNVSGCPDELFFVKMNRRGVPKLEKSEKHAFGESRSLKISENKLSGCPETRKIWKAAPRGAPKHENDEKNHQINNFQTIALSRTDGMFRSLCLYFLWLTYIKFLSSKLFGDLLLLSEFKSYYFIKNN